MGTRWRGLLAPLGITTGDGRRFATDAVTWRELPLGLKWQRNDDMGHDDSVIIGSVDDISIGTVADALSKGWVTEEGVSGLEFPRDTLGVWGTGELFDDVDTAVLPRLAEDVAEARLLTERRVIGPSVDAGAATAVLAEPGSDEEVSEERLEEIFEQAWETGAAIELEVLFTEYQIAAATLVNIPAFAQCLPFTLEPAAADDTAGLEQDAALVAAATQRSTALACSLVAAAGAVADAAAFADPEFTGVTAITIAEADAAGVRRVFGHVAAFGVCHAGIRDVCTTAPTSGQQYAPFHRYLTTASGADLPVPAGRITVAHGALTAACRCCPGIDDHACNRLSMGATIAHYDKARPVAYVRAGEDQFGIWVSGIIAPEASEADVAALARQKVSGDWRETGGSLELVEVLTLNREKPGFPLPRAAMAGGRQMSLVAAGTVSASRQGRPPRPGGSPAAGPAGFDYDRMAQAMTRALGPLLPAGTTLAVDTTPVLEADPAQLAAPAADPVDAAEDAPATDHGSAAATVAGELEATLHAIDAADITAELEGVLADV